MSADTVASSPRWPFWSRADGETWTVYDGETGDPLATLPLVDVPESDDTTEDPPAGPDDLNDDRRVFFSANYRSNTVHRQPDCAALDRARVVEHEPVADLRPAHRLCRKADCWPTRDHVDQTTECPYCGDTVGRLHMHLPCEGSQ